MRDINRMSRKTDVEVFVFSDLNASCVFVILSSNEYYAAHIEEVDVRDWLPSQPITVASKVRLSNVPTQNYKVGSRSIWDSVLHGTYLL